MSDVAGPGARFRGSLFADTAPRTAADASQLHDALPMAERLSTANELRAALEDGRTLIACRRGDGFAFALALRKDDDLVDMTDAWSRDPSTTRKAAASYIAERYDVWASPGPIVAESDKPRLELRATAFVSTYGLFRQRRADRCHQAALAELTRLAHETPGVEAAIQATPVDHDDDSQGRIHVTATGSRDAITDFARRLAQVRVPSTKINIDDLRKPRVNA